MFIRILKVIGISIIACLVIGITVFAVAGSLPVKSKVLGNMNSEYVAMSDGTLIAVYYTLPDSEGELKQFPTILETTRYVSKEEESFLLKALTNLKIAKIIPNRTVNAFLQSDYVFVNVDARGSGASFGQRPMEWSKEEIADMGEVMDWIVKQPWSNGKIGTYGISYTGNTAELALVNQHPALKASAPLYNDFDVYAHSVRPGGILNAYLVEQWHLATLAMDQNRIKDILNGGILAIEGPKGKKLLKQALSSHNTVDIFDKIKNAPFKDDLLIKGYTSDQLSPYAYMTAIQESNCPLYVRVGWMDAGTVNGAIDRFLKYENDQILEIGPWNHGGSSFEDPFIEKRQSREETLDEQSKALVQYFDNYLKVGKNTGDIGLNKIRYYTMGEGTWKTTDTWPVEGFTNEKYYFSEGAELSPTASEQWIGEDSYTVDFTATTGELNRWRTNLGGGKIFYPDRAEEDKKLLTYTSMSLDNEIEITGTPVVTLNVKSDTTDAAFYAYLEDVAPDGKVTYITEGQIHSQNRKIASETNHVVDLGPKHSYQRKDASPLEIGKVEEVKIGLYATSVLIRKGHKIRISIAGHDASNFERIPANQTPTLKIQRNAEFLSYVELPIKQKK